MAVAETEAAMDGFVPLAEVIRTAGVGERIVRRRLREAKIELFSHPWDARRKLIRSDDLARLTKPVAGVNQVT